MKNDWSRLGVRNSTSPSRWVPDKAEPQRPGSCWTAMCSRKRLWAMLVLNW